MVDQCPDTVCRLCLGPSEVGGWVLERVSVRVCVCLVVVVCVCVGGGGGGREGGQDRPVVART